MVTLRKLTLAYDPLEDRIQMRSESDQGNIYTMWLSLRLCREVVSRLTRHLELTQVARTPVGQNQLVQHSLHGKAKANFKSARPVSEGGSEAFLLTRLSIQATDKRVVLKIPLPDAETAVIPLTVEEARQWLELLFQQYKKAGWPLDLWPAWMRGDSPSPANLTAKSLH